MVAAEETFANVAEEDADRPVMDQDLDNCMTDIVETVDREAVAREMGEVMRVVSVLVYFSSF
jgi:hypothetical protein